MEIFLSAVEHILFKQEFIDLIKKERPSILISFVYINGRKFEKICNHCNDILLDSGTFSFLRRGMKKDPYKYIEKYAAFINKYDIKKFFELDIDSIVGYKEVLQLRRELETLTNKRCIPVWHRSRGKDNFLKMCDEYDYVSIGGFANHEISQSLYPCIQNMITEAHRRGAKIHGLGFTRLKTLHKYKFDSVDSSTWCVNSRFGYINRFHDFELKKMIETQILE